MDLVACLDLGASLSPAAACLVADDTELSYGEVQGLSRSVAASLAAYGIGPGATVGVLSTADPLVASCVFGIDRVGASWAVVDPAGPPDDVTSDLVRRLAGCTMLLTRAEHLRLVEVLRPFLPRLRRVVSLDRSPSAGRTGSDTMAGVHGWGEFLVAGLGWEGTHPVPPAPVADAGSTADEAPVYLARQVATTRSFRRWQPVLARGGRIVMRTRVPAAATLSRLEA